MGRELQRAYGQEAQVIPTMPLLEGLDGVKKMSKSLGNYIGIQEAPGVMYSKLVSIPDTLMWRYFELLSFRSWMRSIASARTSRRAPTRVTSRSLAEEIVARFHGEEAAASAHKSAGNRLKDGELPEDLPEIELSSPRICPLPLSHKAGLVKNAAAARDLLGAGSVKVDGQVVDRTFMLALGETRVFQAGKKAFARITLKAE